VDPQETTTVQALLQIAQGLADQMRLLPSMDPGVVAFGPDPIDLLGRQQKQPASRAKDKTVRGALVRAVPLEKREQPPVPGPRWPKADLHAGAIQGPFEAPTIKRFEQVIQSADLECPNGVLIVGRHEDDGRHLLGSDRIDDAEAVHSGHLDVQEDEIGMGLLDCFDGFETAGALTDNLGVGMAGEQIAHPLARRRLVIDDQNADLPLARQG
jgi:hypothetical protein